MMYIPVKCPFNICQSGFVPCSECTYKVLPIVDVLLGCYDSYISPIDDSSDVVKIRPDISEI